MQHWDSEKKYKSSPIFELNNGAGLRKYAPKPMIQVFSSIESCSVRLYSVSFSPTGSSQKVSGWISDVFPAERISVDLCSAKAPDMVMGKEDICVFSMPCYGGRIPKTAAERLAHIRGRETAAILCLTFGNRAYEDALLELAELVTKHGFSVISACAVVTEHNILPVFGKGRPSPEDQQEITAFALASAAKIKQNDRQAPSIPGQHPYKNWGGIHLEIYFDDSNCAACGACADACPVAAISRDDWQTDQEKCIACMRCIKRCPTQSRSLDAAILKKMIEHMRPVCESRKRNEFFL